MCVRKQQVLKTENIIWVEGLDRPPPMPSSPLSGCAEVTVSGSMPTWPSYPVGVSAQQRPQQLLLTPSHPAGAVLLIWAEAV